MLQENKVRQIFRKKNHLLSPDTYTQVCVSRGKRCSFFEKFDLLCFLVTPVLRFVLLSYYRRNMIYPKHTSKIKFSRFKYCLKLNGPNHSVYTFSFLLLGLVSTFFSGINRQLIPVCFIF